MITYGKFFVFKKREPQFISDYCATLAGFIGIYSFSAIALSFLIPVAVFKLIMIAFALSPFLLGLLVTYNTEKYYTWIQVGLFLFSTAFVIM